jgi:hypothetical protein
MSCELVPARYVGSHLVDLQQTGKKWFNIDGSPRALLKLMNGDTVMMPAEEILGKTVYFPKNGNPLYLGVGRVILPEHADVPVDELGLLGYQFDAGRTDFELVEAPTKTPKQTKQAPQAISDSLTINASNIAAAEEKK